MTLGRPLLAAPPGLSPTAKRSLTRFVGLLLLVACLLAPASASAAEPKGCGYGTGGPKATTLCWLDMTAYSDTQARSDDGQAMSVELPGGYTISFTIKSRPGGAITQRAVASAKLPTNGSASYIGNLAYVGIPGKPALYTATGAGGAITTLSLSNIQVKDSSGQAVSGYAFVGADAENTSSAESITWTSDQPIYQVASLSPGTGANGCQNNVSGLGTTSVTCTGKASPAGGTYGTVIVAADTPTTFSQSLYTAGGSNREAVAFALMTSKIQVTKSVVGRVRGSDSFDISATSPEGSTIGSATTGSADSATTGELTVLPRDNGASYTLSEAVTPASGTRPSDYSRSWSCTNNGVAEPSLPSGGDASVSVSPEAGDFISCTVTNTQLPADLVLAKSVNQETAVTGEQLTYTLQVENQGPSGADTTTLIDSLPAGLAYVSDDAGCDTSALPVIECDLGTLLSGESRTVEIVAEVQPAAAGSLLLNTAEVGALQPDSEPSDNKAEASTAVAPFADLAIVKSVSPQVVSSPGEEVTYTLEVENKGEGDSSSTIVADTLPSGLAYVSDTGGCDVSALPTIECDLGELANGVTKTVQIVAEVEPSVAGQLIENTASVSGSTFDPEPKNNESTATVEAEPLSDLAITKAAQSVAKPGENITYLLTAENKGPTTDNFVTVTDTLPPELEYVSDNGACDTSALPKISCEVGMQEKGKQNTITVVAKVLATSGTIENTAEVSGANPDAKPANNKSSATVSVEPVSDLAIEKTVSAPSAKPGEQLTYTLEVENKGPSTSDPTTVSDDLPAGLSYVSDDGGCEATKLGEISCNLGSMAAGATRSIEIVAIVAGSATGTLENTAEVTGPNVDPEPADNESTATTSVQPVADLAIEKTASAPSVKPGEQLTYTLQVENKGPSTSPATVIDTLPAGLTYVSDDAGCDVSALPDVSCDLGPMDSGATATIELLTEVKADASGTIENTAEVIGPHDDPTPADNESTATSSITPLASDLALTKSAPATAVKPGDQITYTLVASNQGPDPSTETVLTDTLPPQLTYVSDDAGCDTSALPEVECDLGTLADGESQTLHIVTRVTATDGQPIQNKARVSGANADPEPGNNPDAAQVPLAPTAAPPAPPVQPSSPPPASKPPKQQTDKRKGTPRLTLTKTASNKRARPGSVISYRITVANRGDAPARGVEVCDHPPASQRTLRTEPRATGEAKPCWRLAKLAAGAERSYTLTAMVKPGSDRGTQRNRATVTAANVKGVRADTAGVRVKPLPQTGCLARHLGGLADVELLC